MNHSPEVNALSTASAAAAAGWGAEVTEKVEVGAVLLLHWL